MRQMQIANGGMCARCGSQAHPVIDTMADILIARGGAIDHGRLYMCGRCVREAAALTGHLTPEEAEGLTERLNELSERIKTLKQSLEEATAEQVKVVPVTELAALVAEARR